MIFHQMPLMGLPPNHFEPFKNNTFRCPRCGSSLGPGCRCMEVETSRTIRLPEPEPFKINPPIVPKFEFKPAPIRIEPIKVPTFDFKPAPIRIDPITVPRFEPKLPIPQMDLGLKKKVFSWE